MENPLPRSTVSETQRGNRFGFRNGEAFLIRRLMSWGYSCSYHPVGVASTTSLADSEAPCRFFGFLLASTFGRTLMPFLCVANREVISAAGVGC